MTSALVVFIIVVAVNAFVLLLDVYLGFFSPYPTISRYVWKHKLWAIPLILWQVIGVVALTIHLLVPR
jgi:hypothetical protein